MSKRNPKVLVRKGKSGGLLNPFLAESDNDKNPTNRFIGSSKTITASTGTSVDFTGLTSSAALIRLTLSTANVDFVDNAPSHIIVPPGQAIACLWDTATGILAGTIDIYEDPGIL